MKQKKRRRLVAFVLAIVLVFGFIPGTGLSKSVRADEQGVEASGTDEEVGVEQATDSFEVNSEDLPAAQDENPQDLSATIEGDPGELAAVPEVNQEELPTTLEKDPEFYGVQIGNEETASAVGGLPFDTHDKYSYSEQIYSASEVGAVRLISGISFKITGAINQNKTIELYLADTKQNSFSDKNNLITPEYAHLVFSDEILINETGWFTIEFADTFVHDPEKNLAVIIVNKTGTYESNVSSLCFQGQQNCGIYADEDNYETIPDPEAAYSINTRSVKNVIRLHVPDETPEEKTITFYKNDGSAETAMQSAAMGHTQQLEANTFIRERYFFRGWNTNPDGSGTAYPDRSFIEVDGDIKLYAQWISGIQIGEVSRTYNSDEIPFHSNYNYGFSEQIYTAEEVGNLVRINRIAYFVENPMEGRNITIYLADTDKNAFTPTAGGATDAVPLEQALQVYAGEAPFGEKLWQEIEFDQPFIHDPAKNLLVIIRNETTYVSGLKCATYEGTEKRCIYSRSDQVNAEPNPEKDYYATSDRNVIRLFQAEEDELESFTIRLMKNDDTEEEITQVSYVSCQARLTSKPFSRSGFRFEGWNTAADGSGIAYPDGSQILFTEDTTLYAQWVPGSEGDLDIRKFSEALPMHSNYKFGFSEQIYTPDEVGPIDGLAGISFYVKNPMSDRTIELYLADVDYTGFSGENPVISLDDAVMVYDGAAPFGEKGWQEIIFDTNYLHDPDKNLVVITINKTGSFTAGLRVATVSGAENCSAYNCTDSGRIEPITNGSGLFTSEKNVLKFRQYVTWPFTDVKKNPGNWVYEAAKYAYENNIMSGDADKNGDGFTTFRPKDSISRYEFVVTLYRMAGSPGADGEHPFIDVPDGKYYSDAVRWAYLNNITTGDSATTFSGKKLITRQQIATMMVRFAEYMDVDTSDRADLSGFPDASKVSGYAKDGMAWANAAGLITGKEVGGVFYLDPKANAKRQEVATILMRFRKAYIEPYLPTPVYEDEE